MQKDGRDYPGFITKLGENQDFEIFIQSKESHLDSQIKKILMMDDQPEFFENLLQIQEQIAPIFNFDHGTLKRINLVMSKEDIEQKNQEFKLRLVPLGDYFLKTTPESEVIENQIVLKQLCNGQFTLFQSGSRLFMQGQMEQDQLAFELFGGITEAHLLSPELQSSESTFYDNIKSLEESANLKIFLVNKKFTKLSFV